ncbi:L,D-transpeptidase family protein [Allosediminivita pacifica]|uniref:Murein L,D-transpeptidase YcbB/YkuD n=1 Tax=Allosediminivita pacifica TaxID=1267769 RepID=A0A2T6AVB8_9RHOB|nr:L,D-transpeptidase family protein [Allosediminivita pacifica]PTX47758.1 murein L,D-transpeptidase YcbB/YkuD [Allosediminivita pacifica]
MTDDRRVTAGRLMRASCLAAALLAAMPVMSKAEGTSLLQLTAYKQAVAEQVSDSDGVADFYRARDFAPIWTGEGAEDQARRAALLEAFSTTHAHGLPEGRYDAKAWMRRMSDARTERERGLLEVELTRLYLRFAHDIQSGILEPGEVVSAIKREPPRRDNAELLARLTDEEPRAVFRTLAPQSPEYARLMREKMRLERLISRGGWGPSLQNARLERGDSGREVVELRDRLIAMGYLKPTLSADYDAALEAAVIDFQLAHGLETDGIAGGNTLSEINVSAEERLESVIVAMERERWLNFPGGPGERHVRVNLVDFHAQIIDDGKLTFATRSVIGHQDRDRQTPEFSDEMEHMVVNPSWYVPRSIIVNEYLPRLRQNPGAVGHIQVVDSRGRVVSRNQSFAQYSASSFPFSMRQPPGPGNALGTVKFMFPNRYAIYLHDTPSKSLFDRDVRTFSHGCIRLSDPHEFAYTLLARQSSDPVGDFQRALRGGGERKISLEQKVPVHLIYRTAYTQAKGPVQYRRDVYGRDARLWDALAAAGVALTGRAS